MIGYDDSVYRCDERSARITPFVCWRKPSEPSRLGPIAFHPRNMAVPTESSPGRQELATRRFPTLHVGAVGDSMKYNVVDQNGSTDASVGLQF
jgi:hypothetical protein